MSGTLAESIRNSLGPIFEDRASALTGLAPEAVRNAIDTAVPVLVAGLADFVRTRDGERRLSELVRGPKVDPGFVERAALAVDDAMTRRLVARGEDLAGALFGARLHRVHATLAEMARIERQGAAMLLALLTPFALTVVKREALRARLAAPNLSRFMRAQATRIEIDDRITRVVDTADPVYLRPSHSRPARPAKVERPRATVEAPGRARAPMLALTAIAAIIAVGGWVLATDGGADAAAGEAEVASERTGEADPGLPFARSSITGIDGALRRIALPDGRAFEAPAGGLTDRLASHLRMGALGEARFPVDGDLRFDPGTARLEPGAGPVLDDVAGVLRAYPDTRIRLEAPAGDALAARRADAIRSALIERGVAEDRFDALRVPDTDQQGIDIILGG